MNEFEQAVAPFRGELKALCYRMSGSIFDADDLLQEAMLRAFKSFDRFEGRSSLRTWLYRITANVCLSALESQKGRRLPHHLGPPGGPGDSMEPLNEPVWLTPAPREEIGLAFLAALQLLPARQRAIVLLREVLGWSAAETAELLEMTVAAVNSAHQRARETLEAKRHDEPKPIDAEVRPLLERYIRAWERSDLPSLVALLREDAVLSMPPIPTWLRGAANLEAAMQQMVFARSQPGEFTVEPMGSLLALRRNGQPYALQQLEVRDGRVAAITAFLDTRLFAAFEAS